MLADRLLARDKVGVLFYVDTKYRNWAGPIAMLVAAVVSIWLFSNQVIYTGLVPAAVPGVGDLTFEVGFVLAAGLYALLRPALDRSRPIRTGGRRRLTRLTTRSPAHPSARRTATMATMLDDDRRS